MFRKCILLLLACGFCEVLGVVNVTRLPVIKTCSCGLDDGDAIVQSLSQEFSHIDGAFWHSESHHLCFVDRLHNTVNTYNPKCGATSTIPIKELEGYEISAIFPITRKHEYLVTANQSLFLLKLKHEDEDVKYSIKEIMKALDDSLLFTKGTTTNDGCIIIGTKPSDYKSPDYTPEQAKVVKINLTSEQVEVVDSGFDFVGGIAFDYHYQRLYIADDRKGKIWCYKHNTTTGRISDKKMPFDVTHHNYTGMGNISTISVDKEGLLWVGMVKSYQVLVLDFKIHKIVRRIALPASATSTLAWGGKHFDTLYVGTMRDVPGVDPQCEPASGRLLAISGTGGKGWQFSKVHVSDDKQ